MRASFGLPPLGGALHSARFPFALPVVFTAVAHSIYPALATLCHGICFLRFLRSWVALRPPYGRASATRVRRPAGALAAAPTHNPSAQAAYGRASLATLVPPSGRARALGAVGAQPRPHPPLTYPRTTFADPAS